MFFRAFRCVDEAPTSGGSLVSSAPPLKWHARAETPAPAWCSTIYLGVRGPAQSAHKINHHTSICSNKKERKREESASFQEDQVNEQLVDASSRTANPMGTKSQETGHLLPTLKRERRRKLPLPPLRTCRTAGSSGPTRRLSVSSGGSTASLGGRPAD